MTNGIGLERCLSFINCQLQPPRRHVRSLNGTHRRAVTLSRQAGAGAHTIAQRLVELLGAREAEASCPWTVFDQNLIEKVLQDHHLPSRLARFMPEDRISEISDTMDELFGLHPPSWILVRKTADTILRLAELGHVILIGRGANVITSKLDYVLHVRLIGSVEKRVERLQQLHRLDHKAALELLEREDNGRRRYLKKYFNKDIEDPLLYHFIINTDLVSCDEAARIIADNVGADVRKL